MDSQHQSTGRDASLTDLYRHLLMRIPRTTGLAAPVATLGRAAPQQRPWCAFLVLLLLVAITSCGKDAEPKYETAWLHGSVDDRLELVAKHLRGFDMAMVETGYRYGELHWAMQDKNWKYADYQVKKIRLSMENGIQRRPKREPSARASIFEILSMVEEAIAERNMALLRKRFDQLTVQCNGCHAAEDVAFFNVMPPATRISSIQTTR